MTFLHPMLAATGLACVAIPILIHLFMRRRRRPVMWGAMRFLLEAYKRQRRRLMLEQIVLLLVRCAMIALIAIALGRLVAGESEAGAGARTLVIVIDDSIASQALDAQGRSALDRHKDQARTLLDGLDSLAGDRAGLIRLSAPAGEGVLPPTADIGRVRRALDGINAADSAADLGGAIALLRTSAPEEEDEVVEVVLLSDWLEGTLADAAGGSAPLDARFHVKASTPHERGYSNTSVVEVRPRRSMLIAGSTTGAGLSGSGQVAVRLRRSGNDSLTERDIPLEIALERPQGRTRLASTRVRFERGQREASVIVPFALRDALPGSAAISARISEPSDTNAIAGDDVRRRVLEIRRALRVGIVSDRSLASVDLARFAPGDWIALALEPTGRQRAGKQIEVEALLPSSMDRARLARLDAVVVPDPERLSEQGMRHLAEFALAGGLILVTPSARAQSQQSLAALLDALQVDWTAGPDPRDLDTSGIIDTRDATRLSEGLLGVIAQELERLAPPVRVDRVVPIEGADDRDIVLRLEDGTPLLLARLERPTVVLLATALDPAWTTLAAKPLMVPLMQEIIRQGAGQGSGTGSVSAGQPIDLPPQARALAPMDETSEPIAVPPASQRLRGVRRSALYAIVEEDDRRDHLLAINPDANAAATDPMAPTDVAERLARIVGEFTWLADGPDDAAAQGTIGAQAGMSLSLTLLVSALALALVETALARAASHAETGGAP